MKNLLIHLLPVLFFLSLLNGCASKQEEKIQSAITEIRSTYIPDGRVDRFDVSYKIVGDEILLEGETTLPDAKRSLLDTLLYLNASLVDSITVLPDESLGSDFYGLVNNSVSNIRSEPKHSAQLATQALLGMPLQILKRSGGWYYVRTPDDYLSWVDSGGITRMDQKTYSEWVTSEKLIYLNTYGFSYAKASTEAEKVSDLVAGNILRLINKSGSFYKVAYPDGRIGYILTKESKPLDQWSKDLNATREDLVTTARSMMGIPYLWGGTSTKGVDCSGFTKTVFFMNGLIIPRDASQQVHAGIKVDQEKNWDQLEVGDLLFFGVPETDDSSRRVVHVGMWIGNHQFIHASRQVRISSVNPDHENFDEYNTNRYLESRRYLQNSVGNIIPTESMYEELSEWMADQ